MSSLKRLSRIGLLSLLVSVLTLGVIPVVTVQAQQSAQAQTASPAETRKESSQLMKDQKKKLAEAERTPLSEEEMEGVKGEWAGIALGVVGISIGLAQIWQNNHNAHGHPSEIHLHTGWSWWRGPYSYVEFHHNVRR